MSIIALGQNSLYKNQYDPTLLFTINRNIARSTIGIGHPLPFYGYDIWNCYEVSWLNRNNKPEVRILELYIPADSEKIIESKSLKLYLNSLNNTRFDDYQEVKNLIERDISLAVKSPITIIFEPIEKYNATKLNLFEGVNLDLLDVTIENFNLDKNLLALSYPPRIIEEVLYSNLLKSNCLVTGQPDWASVQICYKGKSIAHDSLLKYLISFRNHNEFHEQCIERIFIDISEICQPETLTIYARYTRRGGIDINPIRSTCVVNTTELKNQRHVRQ